MIVVGLLLFLSSQAHGDEPGCSEDVRSHRSSSDCQAGSITKLAILFILQAFELVFQFLSQSMQFSQSRLLTG